ncbi:hypothetical protein Tco_0501310, partial [Tanacetum coccineum]
DAQKDRAAVRAEIEILRRERLAYEQEGMETRQALARSEDHCRTLEARVTLLETEALEAGARIDTLEDTGSVTPPNWVAAEYGSGACYFMNQQHKR